LDEWVPFDRIDLTTLVTGDFSQEKIVRDLPSKAGKKQKVIIFPLYLRE
jgi:hypothetical protein